MNLHLVIFLLATLLVGCGKTQRDGTAQLNVSSLSLVNSEIVSDTTEEFNMRTGKELVSLQKGGFPIRLNVISQKEIEAIEPREQNRLGHALLTESSCQISLSEELLKPKNKDYLKTVLWHEYGHCFGFRHDDTPDQIMSAISYPITHYKVEAITAFFNRLLGSSLKN